MNEGPNLFPQRLRKPRDYLVVFVGVDQLLFKHVLQIPPNFKSEVQRKFSFFDKFINRFESFVLILMNQVMLGNKISNAAHCECKDSTCEDHCENSK